MFCSWLELEAAAPTTQSVYSVVECTCIHIETEQYKVLAGAYNSSIGTCTLHVVGYLCVVALKYLFVV